MTYFYLPHVYAQEKELAFYINRLLDVKPDRIKPQYGNLEGDQQKAVDLACKSSLSILRGYPGTGKTTTLRQIVKSFDADCMTGIILCPYGKAAKRAYEAVITPELSSGNSFNCQPECMTIHRGLEYSYHENGFLKNAQNPIDADYVIIDEGSTGGLSIMRDLFSAIDFERTRVIISGDPYQLPSIESGNVMHDLIMTKLVPDTELTKIYRQGVNSGIALNAKRILNGEDLIKRDPVTGELFEDFYFVPKDNPEDTASTIIEYVSQKIPEKRNIDPKDIQVLSPGKKSVVGTVNLNKELRKVLNKGNQEKEFNVGDRVINKKNVSRLNITNGDVGYIKEIARSGITVDFGQGAGPNLDGIVEMDWDSVNNLHLAYSFTAHSSQGSEFPVVISPIHTTHWQLLFRNLLYTIETRAKILNVLIGDSKALKRAISHTVVDKRVTGLQYNLLSMNKKKK